MRYKSSLACTPVLKCTDSPTEFNRSLGELDNEAGNLELLIKGYVDMQCKSVDEWRSKWSHYRREKKDSEALALQGDKGRQKLEPKAVYLTCFFP